MKKKIEVKGEPISICLQTEIIARFMTEKDLKSFWDSYKTARKHDSTVNKPPTELQKKMAELRKKGTKINSIAAQFKVKPYTVDAAIKKVAIYGYLHS